MLKKGYNMTITEFLLLCGKHNIEPAMILEHEKIVEALKKRDDKEVERLFNEEI